MGARTGNVGAAGLSPAAASALVVMALLAAPAGAPAVTPSGFHAVLENGPSSNRVNIFFLGDGYTLGQIDTTYTDHIDTILAHMFGEGEEPFARYRNFFNVYRVDIVSQESGADVPPEHIYRDTALNASYYYDGGPERLLYVDPAQANAALTWAWRTTGIFPDMNLITVNDTRYGGGGGAYAVLAGGNVYAGELALHELGHSFSGLDDEYYPDPNDPNTVPTTYTGGEPYSPNVTKDPAGQKWAQWLGYVDSLGSVGAYEGASGATYGLYRPTETSKMRQLGQAFNAVCREQIVLDIYDNVHPLDGYLMTDQVLVDPPQLWVDVVDPNVIQVDWYVDNTLVAQAGGETFCLGDHGFGPGEYWVKAKVFDSTDWVRLGCQNMKDYTDWIVELTPEPATAILLIIGALAICRPRRAARHLPALRCDGPALAPRRARN